MDKKGIEFSASTMAIIILALIFTLLALAFTSQGNELMAYFETEIAGRSPKGAYSNFVRRCGLVCTVADNNFNESLDPSQRNREYDYCNITMDTTELGGIPKDHCYKGDGGVVNVTCVVTTVKNEKCVLTNGCGSCG